MHAYAETPEARQRNRGRTTSDLSLTSDRRRIITCALSEWDRIYAALPSRRWNDTDHARDRYRDFLSTAPGPKSGHGNDWLFKAGLRAKWAEVPADEAVVDIGAAMPHKPHREVARQVWRAFEQADTPPPRTSPRVKPIPSPAVSRLWAEAIRRWPAEHDPVEALWESSPMRIDWPPEEDALHVLRALYAPDEYIFIGPRYGLGVIGDTIRTAGEWYRYVKHGGTLAEHWMPNPLTGKATPKADGTGQTLRGNNNVASYRYAVAEIDTRTHAAQAAMLLLARFPVAAVIDSGGKSLHAWLRADCVGAEQWAQEVQGDLFPRILEPIGYDEACKNPARLSRTPGARRDNGNVQRLLYLAPGVAS